MGDVCHSRTLFFTFCCSTASCSCMASLSKAESWFVFSWSLEGQDAGVSLSSHLPHGQQAPEMETTALPILVCSGIYTQQEEEGAGLKTTAMAMLEWDLVFYSLTSNNKQSSNWLAVHTQKEEAAT